MRENGVARFVFQNLGWIAGSVFLALVVWMAANMANNPVEQREMQNIVVDVQLPDGYVLTRPNTVQRATVIVRAPKDDWDLLLDEDIHLTADLSDIRRPDEYEIELKAEIADPIHGKVVAIRPNTMTFTIDQEAEKRVPVNVVVSNEPPLGYTYPDILCDPTEVVVNGSAERVNQVVQAEARLNLSDERNPILGQSYSLTPINKDGRTVTSISLEPATVSCSVDIQPRTDVIQMRVLPAIIGDPPSGYIFEGYIATPESVGVTGDRSAISDMAGLVYTEPIDLEGQTQTYTAEVQLELPDGVQLVPENQLISVTVTISPVRSSRQFQEVSVELTGLDPTVYRATVLPNAVTVLVVGPEALLPARDDVRVTVDLTGLASGNHLVTPQGVILDQPMPDGMVISVRPEQLSVTIEALDPTPQPTPTITPTSTTEGDRPMPNTTPDALTPTPGSVGWFEARRTPVLSVKH